MRYSSFSEIRVGIFVFLGLLCSFAIIFFLGGRSLFLQESYPLNVKFKDTLGLREGSPVFLSGIAVGIVKEISFSKDLNETEVVVRFTVDKAYQERIREDSLASIETQGLLGDKAIILQAGSSSSPVVFQGGWVKARVSFSWDQMASRGIRLIDDFETLSKNINGMIQDVRHKKSLLHALIYEPQGGEVIREIGEVAHFASRFFSDLNKHQVAENVGISSKNMKKVSLNFSEISSRIEKGEGSLGGLINDPTVYEDLKTLLGKANRSKLIRAVIRHTLSQNEKDALK